MPKNKDLKRLIRARMEKTGESYTGARAVLLERAGTPDALELTLAAVAGHSDELVKERTGCDWASWVKFLDAESAAELPHREIAKLAAAGSSKMSGWWAQTVTVGYERIKGLREIGQRRSGTYDASKSKTIAVPVGELFQAFRDGRRRKHWLPDVDWRVRTETVDRSIRIDWQDGSKVSFWFSDKGAKSSVSVQHGGLPSKAARERGRKYWGERLAALGELLAPKSG